MNAPLSTTDRDEALDKSVSSRAVKPGSLLPRLLFFVIVIALGAIGAAYYFYNEAATLKNDPQKVATEEAQMTIELIGELIVLPVDEQPTIATVTDPERLKEQPFFANAKRGDKVLIYTNARKAILYDPIAHKIVEVAPLNIGNQ